MITKIPISALKLFPELNRDTYQQLTGRQAPVYNPALQIKPWFDPSAASGDPAGTVTYTVYDQAAGGLRTITMTKSVAATVNLPGTYTYPVYAIAPTVAVTVNGLTGVATSINTNWICEEAAAEALAAELGGAAVIEAAPSAWPFTDVWGTETRRQWLVVVNGDKRNAAQLIKQKYDKGVGAPGHWVVGAGEPTWVSEIPTGEVKDLRPWVPTPIRALQAGERLEVTPMGAYVLSGEDDQAPASGGYTDADRADIGWIKAAIKTVGAKLGVDL